MNTLQQMSKKILSIGLKVAFAILLLNCSEEKAEQSDDVPDGVATSKKTITVFNQTNEVDIPVKGELDGWVQKDISVQYDSRLISVLIEKNERVAKDDLIASAIVQYPDYSYQPINLRAPFNGIVTNTYYNVGDSIIANKPILTIKNFEQLQMTVEKKPFQIEHIRQDQNVTLFHDDDTLKGFVKNVNTRNNRVVIAISNQPVKYTHKFVAQGRVHLGKISGSYILADYFDQNSPSLTLETDSGISILVHKVGLSDSLALIYPALPDQHKINLIQKKLDL